MSVLLHEWLPDEIVIQELIEDIELLNEELIESVDNCAHDTNTMSLDRVVHLVDTNGLDLLGFKGGFDEDLGVKVVVVLWDELAKVSQKLKDIDTLFEGLGW